jgi:arginine N-succinyltransferase
MTRFEIRAALPRDADDLLALARHLDTVNLPADDAAIAGILDKSQKSFGGKLPDEEHVYVFILRDIEADRAVGTSTLVAQLGRPDAPYIYFDVSNEEKYSRDLKLHFDHTRLRLGFSYDGPTELAGLVVDPAYRRRPGRLGLAISYVRMLFVAAYRERFQNYLLAELLPPLEPDGTSHLWNALGRRFTNMTYRHADRLSHENKDFIRDLFPSGPVYASLLSEAAQAVIGRVGHPTKGVEKMLRRIGFRYAKRVDPFDGGPHFVAKTDEVTVVRSFVHGRARATSVDGSSTARPMLLARLSEVEPFVRAVSTSVVVSGEDLGVEEDVLVQLGAGDGEEVVAVSMP